MAKATTTRISRPAKLAHGRWLTDLEPPKLRVAENALVECCKIGEPWKPEKWNKKRPEKVTNANRIRASLIRFLLLGGDEKHPVHERGVQLEGAWIEGSLDLKEVDTALRLQMYDCRFQRKIDL